MHLNLIALFTFYLSATFLISSVRRWQQYQDMVRLLVAMPGRWPKLMRHMSTHKALFTTTTLIRPLAIALVLLVVQWICSKMIWPKATITLSEIVREWWMWPLLGASFLTMLVVDTYFLVRVGQLDRAGTEVYLDLAEHWLGSWKAPVIKIITFGFVNPRQLVHVEVRKALEDGRDLMGKTLWWVSLQTGLRLVAGASLWLSWALLPA